ncbi:MAG TPA: phosphoribosylanthranilate isomerase [Thermoanaerobaculia bacterium]|nr:phosphoribosylanthranilate isomerase [Thermoanaerobaculia bacterium]
MIATPAAPAVKICGVTRVEDARRCVALGADLIGLNFHPGSPRCVTEERALELRRAIGDATPMVGVFVHQGVVEAEALARRVGLDLLQFHGERPPDGLEAVAERAIAVLRPDDAEPGASPVPLASLWGVLLDAPIGRDAGGERLLGGTGRAWRYHRAAELGAVGTRLLLAGGIGPGNATAALAVDGVWGIDVCSGVESSPGVKDSAKLELLFARVARRREQSAHPGSLKGA